MSELRGLGALQEELARRGGTIVAVFRGTVDQAHAIAAGQRLPFPVLADADAGVIRAFGLLHAGGGPGGTDIALPAHVLVDRDGRIARRFVAPRIQQRADLADDLRALAGLPGPPR